MAAVVEPGSLGRAPGWIRQYPPLASLVIALLIAALILPSALNLPQSNPSTVLEYAPVPPDDDTPPPNDGNLSALGLGSSSGLTTGSPPNTPTKTDPKREGGKGKKAVTKRCVGKPLRQTEDPNSPPCVPFFEGDNGGATWQGVTEDEIVVLIYYSAYTRLSGEQTPTGRYCDIDKPANTDPGCINRNGVEDISPVKAARALSRYFNERFQTYARHVHVYMYWSSADSASERKADANANWDFLKPFAVVDQAFFGGFNQAYQEAMVRRRVNVYGSFVGLANEYYRSMAPQVWSFWPDIEHAADMFVSYVCNKIAPYPVANSGVPGDIGKPRKIGFLYTVDKEFPGLTYYAELAMLRLENCPNGAKLEVVEEATYSRNQYQTDASPQASQEAQANIAKFQKAGVTTIIWLQGYETQHSQAAFKATWFPEWIFAGDQLNDGIDNGRSQKQEVWKYAWGISNFLNEANPAERPCVQAFRESDPNYDGHSTEFADLDACTIYRDLFTLFKSIQLAGPELTPESVDQGHHAIPRYKSEDPRVAACFYDPGDYTCVKDAMEVWWDPEAPDPEREPDEKGCYRMVRGGERYLADTWEGTDRDVFRNGAGDPCNTVDTATFIGTGTEDE